MIDNFSYLLRSLPLTSQIIYVSENIILHLVGRLEKITDRNVVTTSQQQVQACQLWLRESWQCGQAEGSKCEVCPLSEQARSVLSVCTSCLTFTSASAKAWTESETSPRSEGSADDFPLLEEENNKPQKGCWHGFTNLVGGMWSTREMTPINTDKEIYVRTTIRELVVYCIFIFVLCMGRTLTF